MSDKAYKDSKKAAVDAVVASRARHLAHNQSKNPENSLADRLKYNDIAKKLAREKVEDLEDMVVNADKTNGRVSIDISDDDKMFINTKSVTGDFDEKDGHMSLHVIRGESKLLDKNRVGRTKSTGYGENDKFIRDVTKKDVKQLAKDKFEKEKKKMGLKEDLSVLFEDANLTPSEIEYKKYVNNHIQYVKKAYDYIKKNLPEIFDRLEISMNEMNKRIEEHDKSKFSKEEFTPYADHWFGVKRDGKWGPKDDKSLEYDAAWKHHYETNGHHEEYWGKNKDMPYSYILELLCDWLSFSIKKGRIDEISEFWKNKKNEKSVYMSQKTIKTIDELIKKVSSVSLKESEFSDDLKNIYGSNLFEENLKISIDNITSKLPIISDVIDKIKDIQYGFISKKDGCRIVNRNWIHNCKNLGEYYEVQEDPEKTINEKLGICTDQCIAIKYLFEKNHPNFKTQMYALMKGRFGHCVIGFNDGQDWYYLENAWDKERGLHGPFKSDKDLEKYFKDIYYKHHCDDNSDPVILQKYEEYLNLTENVNFQENIYYNIGIRNRKK